MRTIDGDELYRIVDLLAHSTKNKEAKYFLDQVLFNIDNTPTVAAAPEVHGRWEWYEKENGNPISGRDYDWGWRCSNCKTPLPDDYDDPDKNPKLKFCNECGARMDAEEENHD